jgi:hypothetical protein
MLHVSLCPPSEAMTFVVPLFLPLNTPVESIVPTRGLVDVSVKSVMGRECCTESASYADAVSCTARIVSVTVNFGLKTTYATVDVLTKHESVTPLHVARTYPLSV